MSKRSNGTPKSPFPPAVAVVIALLVPGMAHVVLGRKMRGLAFFGIVVGCLLVGLSIGGRLPWQFSGAPLPRLATLGALGAGLPVLIARLGFGYEADPAGAGFEYGGAFILTAGLMNLLLIMDAWDVALGRDEMIEELDDPEADARPQSDDEKDSRQKGKSAEGAAARGTDRGSGRGSSKKPGRREGQKSEAQKSERQKSERQKSERPKKGAR